MNTLLAINVRAVTYGLRLTLGLLLIVMLNGCGSSVKVVADHDPATDFSSYRTYQWMPEPEADQMQRELIWRDIKQAIDHELGQRSMQQVESNPDVYVGIFTCTAEKVKRALKNGPYGMKNAVCRAIMSVLGMSQRQAIHAARLTILTKNLRHTTLRLVKQPLVLPFRRYR